ncbi:DUF643 domain-containing protein [Borreliella japonica]|uniref:DUF643 domain-containing protein n=1 Tax=Borreliella japonica TaxID=34095 RepID=UPI003AF0E393
MIDNMHVNKVSDFYDNLDQEVKKGIRKLYKTGKSINEIINKILKPEKEFVQEILKDKRLIKKYEISENMNFDFSYKEGMLEKCLERLGEYKSIEFLVFVSILLNKINKKVVKRKQLFVITNFADILFISIHYYDKRIFTSNYLMNAMKGFYELIKSRFLKVQ